LLHNNLATPKQPPRSPLRYALATKQKRHINHTKYLNNATEIPRTS